MKIEHSFLLAASHSGAGKTTLSLAILCALQARGYKIQACKVGPDFIDTAHLSYLSKSPAYNLDTWMGGEDALHKIYGKMLQQSSANVLLVEGVMGLYDGATDIGGLGSSAHVAHSLDLPIVLILDVKGMGQSAVALASGFVNLQPHLHFAGIICNNVGSLAHEKILAQAFAQAFPEQSLPVLGYMRKEEGLSIHSRHLGLHLPCENLWTSNKIQTLTNWAEKYLDIDTLLSSTMHTVKTFTAKPSQNIEEKACIGIAYDAAFAFLYADMPTVLEELGAKCIYFSPLNDTQVPKQCTALYFPGGYPELYAEKLTNNTTMMQSIRDFAKKDLPIYAECGGYMYLMQEIVHDHKHYPMCALLPHSAYIGKEKAALGYRQVNLNTMSRISFLQGKGHEFHYGRIFEQNCLIDSPLWQVYDKNGQLMKTEAQGIIHKNIMGSWIHLYPTGSKNLLAYIFKLI